MSQAESREEDIRNEVRNWLEKVDKQLKEHAAFEDRMKENKRCICGCLPDCRWRCKLSKQAQELASEFVAVLAEQRFDNVSLPSVVRAPEFRRTESMAKFQLFSSTETAMNEVMEALRSDGNRVIGVHGMGGVGKTTMVKQVAARAVSEGLFHIVVMATVSQTLDWRRIQSQIGEGLGLESLGASTEEGAATKIRNRIAREKKVLIILDDLWTELNFNRVGIPYGSELENCESKIIITTRREQVCAGMKSHMIKLKHLSEPDSWEFFKRTADMNFNSEKFEEIGKLVANECGGLPIALVAVAKALGGKQMEVWYRAAKLLQRSMPYNLIDEDETAFKCIKLSYDFLNRKEKDCFLLCCLFPEDHNVGKEELARYGMGLDLFKEANTIEEAREYADLIADKLIASGLLLDGDKKDRVKMHDVIRDVAILIKSADHDGGEEPFFMVKTGRIQKEWPKRKTYERYSAISLMCSEINRLPDDVLDCTILQTLMLQENSSLKEMPSTFFKSMNDLMILNLDGIKASSLPSSIDSLKNLRTLHLDRCKLNDITILGLLETLEILSLRESLIQALPEEMGNLRNLRMLDLTLSLNIEKIPYKLISSLSSLEELYLKGSFLKWEDAMELGTTSTHLGRNAFFDELVNLSRLTILKVDIEDVKCLPRNVENVPNWAKFDICICRSPGTRMMNVHLSKRMSVYSRNLLLDTQMKNLPNWFIKKVAEESDKLIYSDCKDLNMLEEYEHGRLASLKSLVVEQCQEVCYLMRETNDGSPGGCAPVFESLQELRIFHMDVLKEICVGELPTGSFEKLKYMEVQQCNSLVNSLLPPNMTKGLGNLEKLVVNVSSVKEVFGFEGLEQGQVYLGRLQEIRLDDLYALENIYRGPARFADFRNLKFVTVIRCSKLRYLFSVSISESLSQLEDIWVEECDLMEELIRSEIEVLKLPRLKTLSLKKLPMLSNFYAGNGTLECPALEHLWVQECQNFRTLASDFRSSKQIRENDEQHMKLLKKRMGAPEY